MRRRHLEASDVHPATLRRELRRRDLAYGGFLYFGLVLAGGFALNWMPSGWWLYRFVSLWFGFPVLVVSWPVGLIALGYSLTVWREWPLWILAVFVVSTPGLLWLSPGSAGTVDWLGLYFVGFALIGAGLPLWWFLVERRRLLSRPR